MMRILIATSLGVLIESVQEAQSGTWPQLRLGDFYPLFYFTGYFSATISKGKADVRGKTRHSN